jgi:CRISPR-associated endonuclease Csn1
MRASYRLGIDIGTNSLGWCVLDLDRAGEPRGTRRLGVRIFSDGRDPQSGTSLAVARRVPRQQRRRRDRYLGRRAKLIAALVRHGLMPAELGERKMLQDLDPYRLRARGLDAPLTPFEFGRVLFHLDQRRGFKSNRKTDRGGDEKEVKGMKGAIAMLDAAISAAGARSLGEYLWKARRSDGHGNTLSPRACKPVRARRRGVGAKAEWDLYPSRAMYEAEFDALWAAQARHNPMLTDAARDEIRGILFFQRELRPVDPGKCALDPTDQRAPWALPSAQRFRLLQQLADLKWIDLEQREHALDPYQRAKVLEKLERTKELSFDAMRRQLGFGSEIRFNLESEKRTHLNGDDTGARLARKTAFGTRWWNLTLAARDAIVERLLAEEDERALLDTAMQEWSLDADAARVVSEMPLPEGYMRLGRGALSKLVPIMASKGLGYSDAAAEAGYHHSDRRGEILDALPYYGAALEHAVAWGSGNPDDPEEARYGRIANPTVHIGLNQLRKVVNALVRLYGPPSEIVVELARELKLGKEQKDRIAERQTREQKKNDERRRKLAELGLPENGENLMRLRLWEELNQAEPQNRRCVYTGEPISIERLFGPEVEIEHILPFQRTLDNSAANRTVALRRANRDKGNSSPWEAFHTRTGYDWEGILLRASSLPPNKRWRFSPDAMARFDTERGFLDRQLVDTAYLARVTREYLAGICDPNRVWVIPGRLTEMLRRRWGLNRLLSDHNLKNRTDHRHHAIDAFVVGVTDRSLLQRVARAADQERERLIDDMPEPWDGFREELGERLRRIVISHKPDHGKAGKLHEETAYGIVADPAAEGGATLVYRKPLDQLNENEIERIRDPGLRARVRASASSCGGDKLALRKALSELSEREGIRRVRLLKTEQSFVTIREATGAYKALIPGDNHHVDIVERPDGRWDGYGVTVFAANQKDNCAAENGARVVMRIHKGDLLKMEHDGQERIMRAVRLAPQNGRLYLAEHHESGDLAKRHADKDDPFRWALVSFNQLKVRGARRVGVDVLGRVSDPGPPR